MVHLKRETQVRRMPVGNRRSLHLPGIRRKSVRCVNRQRTSVELKHELNSRNKPASSLGRVRDGTYLDGVVSVLHMPIRDFIAASRLAASPPAYEQHCSPRMLRHLGRGDPCRHRFDALGQTIRRPSQSSDDLHFLPPRQSGILGCNLLRSCTICRCNRWRGHRHCSLAGRAGAPNNSLRRDTSRNVRGRCCVHCRSGHFVCFDAHRFVHLQSQLTFSLHAVFCRRTLRDFYHARDTALRNEHESRAQPLARRF